jgi:AcrR family transcriptional regulator
MPYAEAMTQTKTSGGGDPARTIATLWGVRQPQRRGPRHTLTPAQVVDAAIAIADCDQDLEYVSMRRVAERLGVGTMSLYTYIASRDELVEAMLDKVYAEAVHALNPRRDQAWQDGLRQVAQANWDLHMRHSWVLQASTGRPGLGPHSIAKYEYELTVIEDIGLTDIEMDAVISLLHAHVEGVASRRIEADRVVRRTGITDQMWWQAVEPALSEVFDPSQFPIAARVGQTAGQAHQAAQNPEHAYTFGLERLIAGIAVLVHQRPVATT